MSLIQQEGISVHHRGLPNLPVCPMLPTFEHGKFCTPCTGSSDQNHHLVKSLSHVRLFATLRSIAHQAPLSMGFSRQEYWSGLPFPSPGDLPNPGVKPRSPTLQAYALTSEPTGKPRKMKMLEQIYHLRSPHLPKLLKMDVVTTMDSRVKGAIQREKKQQSEESDL